MTADRYRVALGELLSESHGEDIERGHLDEEFVLVASTMNNQPELTDIATRNPHQLWLAIEATEETDVVHRNLLSRPVGPAVRLRSDMPRPRGKNRTSSEKAGTRNSAFGNRSECI